MLRQMKWKGFRASLLGCFAMALLLAGGPASAEGQARLLVAPDGESLYVVHADGRVDRRALPGLEPLARTTLGESLRGAALSHDGRFLALGAPDSTRLLILDAADLHLVKGMVTRPTRQGRARVAHIETMGARNAFLVGFSDTPQLWEVNYQVPPPAGFGNWVHDYRRDSGEAKVVAFPVRKLWLDAPLPEFRLDAEGVFVSGFDIRGRLVVFDLDLGRTVASMPPVGGSAAKGE